MLVLSLFPGIGLLDMAFEEAGFVVVRGPDALWGGDIRNFTPPPGRFDGIIGGPPCQSFSRLRYLVEYNGYKPAENMIPEFERVVLAAHPDWFLMENVKDAPCPVVTGYTVESICLNNRMFGGEQNRERVFSFGTNRKSVSLRKFIRCNALDCIDKAPTVCASGGLKPGVSGKDRNLARNNGHKTAKALKDSIRLQGLPEGYLDKTPFTLAGKHKVIGNGVPLPMGRAVAQAIKSMFQCLIYKELLNQH